MTRCPDCNTQLAKNTRYCPKCGRRIKGKESIAGEVALIQDEISHCQYNERVAAAGIATGIVIGGFSLGMLHETIFTIGGFGLAILSLIAGSYYTDKREKLKKKLKKLSGG